MKWLRLAVSRAFRLRLGRIGTFSLILSLFLVGLALFWLTTSKVERVVVRDRLVALAKADVASTVGHLHEALLGYLTTTQFVSRDHRLAVSSLDSAPVFAELAPTFLQLATTYVDILQIRVIDRNGMEVVRVNRRDERLVVSPAEELQNKADHAYFRETSALPAYAIYVSAVDLNVEHGMIEVPWTPVIRVAIALPDQSGIFIINFNAHHLLTFFERVSPGALPISIVDAQGHWLTGADEDRLWGAQRNPADSLAREQPELWSALVNRRAGIYSADGTDYVFQPVAVSDLVDGRLDPDTQVVAATDWYVIAAISPDQVSSAAYGFEPAVLGAALLLSVLTSWLWSGAIADRKQAQAAEVASQEWLLRSKRSAALGNMVAGIAHELNTPIGNAVTVSSTLSEQVEDFDKALGDGATMRRSDLKRFVSDMRQGTDVMLRGLSVAARLVSDFKQVAVDQVSEKRRVFDLDQYVDEVCRMLKPNFRAREVRLEVKTHSGAKLDSFPGALA